MSKSVHSRNGDTDDLSLLEAYLNSNLEPITPRKSFERNLEHRIEKNRDRYSQVENQQGTIMILLYGMIAAVMVISLGVQVFIRLANRQRI